MTETEPGFAIRRCRLADINRLRAMLQVSWHSAHDTVLGPEQARDSARHILTSLNLGGYALASRLFPRAWGALVATAADTVIGFALARRDGAEIILYMLYVHPDRQGQGIGTALLAAAIASSPAARAIRLEVLQGNTAAIAWYEARGFQTYGDTQNATGIPGIPAYYMDKQLVRD